MDKELIITMTARDNATKALQRLKGNLAGANLGGQALSRTFTQMGATFRRLATIIAGGAVIYALVRAFRSAINEAIEFDKRLHDLWTLADSTAKQMKELGKQVRFLALDFNVTGAQALTALYEIYSATFYASDAILILKESLKAAAAGISDVTTAADMFTTVLNAWRMSAEQTSYVSDLMFATVKYGKTRFEELAHQFGRLAGVAAPAGVSIREMTAAIATLTRQGIATDWAVTSLRQSLMQILRPTEELTRAFKTMGHETGRGLIAEVGFADALKTIGRYAIATRTPLEKLFTNVRAITAILPLATTALGEYNKDLERQANALGMRDEAFEKQRKSISYQIGVMKTAMVDFGGAAFGAMFENVAAIINDRIVPALKRAVFWVMENGAHLRFLGKQFLLFGKMVAIVFGVYKAFRLLMSPIIWLTAAAGFMYLAWQLNLFKTKELVTNTASSIMDAFSNIYDKAISAIDFVFTIAGKPEIADSMRNLPDALKVALGAIVGIKLAGWLIGGIFAATAAFVGSSLVLPKLAVLAYFGWTIANFVDDIKTEGFGAAIANASSLIGGVLGGIIGALFGHPILGYSIGAMAGYAAKIVVKALMKIDWDIENAWNEFIGGAAGPGPQATFSQQEFEALLRDLGLKGYQAGGPIGGVGLGDIIPAMLEPGEFVIPKWMMDIPALRSLIEGVWSAGPRMQAGGLPSRPTRSEISAAALLNLAPLAGQFSSLESSMASFVNWLVANMEVTDQSTEFLMKFTEAIGSLFIPLAEAYAEFEQLQLDIEQFTNAYDEAMEELIAETERLRAAFEDLTLTTLAEGRGLEAVADILTTLRTGQVAALIPLEGGEFAQGFVEATLGQMVAAMQDAESKRTLIEGFLEFAKGIEDESANIKKWIAPLEEMLAAFNEFLGSAEDLEDMTAAMSGFTSAIKGLIGGTEAGNIVIAFMDLYDAISQGIDGIAKILDVELDLDVLGIDTKVIEGVLGLAAGVIGIPTAIVAIFDAFAASAERQAKEAEKAHNEFVNDVKSMGNAAIDAAKALWRLAEQSESLRGIQELMGDIQQGFISSLFDFLWPIAGVLFSISEMFIEVESSVKDVAEDISDSFASFNIPAGFKALRAAWGVATPGQPWGLEEEDTTQDKIEKQLTFIEEALSKWKWLLDEYSVEIQAAVAPFRNLIDALSDMAVAIAPAVLEAFLSIIGSLGAPIDALAKWVTDVLTQDLIAFSEGFKKFWDDMVDPFLQDEFFPQIGEWLNRMYGWLDALFEFFSADVWSWLSTDVWGAIKPFVDAVLDMFEEFGKWVSANWLTIKDVLLDKLRDILDGLKTNLGDFLDKVKGWLTGSDDVGKKMSDLAWLMDILAGSLQFLRAAVNAIEAVFKSIAWALVLAMNGVILVFNMFISAFNFLFGWLTGNLPSIPYMTYPQLHEGGIVKGLAGREVIARLMPGEEVLTARDPRHANNGGGYGGDTYVTGNTFVLPNVTDPESFKRELNTTIHRANRRATGNRFGTLAAEGRV